jgi:hypothetical protein
MTQADTDEVPFANEEEIKKPNHMIIWLDKHIGKPGECVRLKSSFFMAMDPTTRLYERCLNKDDIDRSLYTEVIIDVLYNEVEFMLQVFDDPGKCFEAIKKTATSASFSSLLVQKEQLLYQD